MENLLLCPAGSRSGSARTTGSSGVAVLSGFGSVRLLDLVLRAAYVESEKLVVLELEIGYRNMPGLERILDDLCQVHCKPFKVKYFRLGSLDGIHDVVVRSLW